MEIWNCVCGHDQSQHVKSGPYEGECMASDSMGNQICDCEVLVRPKITGMLKILEAELPKIWTQDQYSKAFNDNPSVYKDFQHAALHVSKALQKLQNMVEEADHISDTPSFCFKREEVEKYLADIVISVVRMALKNPSGPVDLEKAISFRVNDKMGVNLPREM